MFSRAIGLKNLTIIAILAVSLAVLSINVNKPFVGQHDFMGAFEGAIAKNYLIYGPLRIKFAQVSGPIINVGDIKSVHLSYLPLLPLLIAISFKIFGVSEAAVRLVPILFSLAGVFYFFQISSKIWGQKVAIFATLFYIFTPMFIYYGKLTTTEPPVISCSLAVFYYYILWIEKKDQKNLVLMFIWVLIGGLIGWSILYITFLIFLHSLIVGEFSFELLLPAILAILTVVLLLIHSFILTGSFLTPDIIGTLKFRLVNNNVSFGGLDFSFKNYLRQEISWIQAYFTRTLLVFSTFGFIINLKGQRFKLVTLLAFLLFGISHLLIFSRYVFIHDFMNFFLLPFLALTGGLAMDSLINFAAKFDVNSKIIYLAISIVFGVFVFERMSFTRALLDTKMNQPGREIGLMLNKIQSSHNQAVIASPRFMEFYGPFTNYYSDLSVNYSTDKDLEKDGNYKKYRYVITFDEDVTDKKFYDDLVQSYPSQRSGEMTVIKTNE